MRLLLRKNFWAIFLADMTLLILCYFYAYWLRFDGRIDRATQMLMVVTLVPLLLCKMSSFIFFDLYKGMWRYTSINDLVNVIKGAVAGSLLFVVYLAGRYHFLGISRSVILADLIFTIVAIGGLRLLIRLYFQRQPGLLVEELSFWRRSRADVRKVLIWGIDPCAERLLRELSGGHKTQYKVIGFVDESSVHKGMKIHGVPILGSLEDIPHLVVFYEIDDIFIAVPNMPGKKIKIIIETCAGLGVRFKAVPSLTERINGAIADHLRDIKVEDLLAREPVQHDMSVVRRELEGKTFLVTGAGGSIGSELARQIMVFHPETLVLLDNAETPLYNIEMELRRTPGSIKVIPCIGDIRSMKNLDRIFKQYKPDVVYHAAAYKHVPMMEIAPLDAIHNNILGTYKVATIACKYAVEKFVMISTDKAVKPSSIMGATKRVAEMIVQSMNGNGTRFAVVRFGNVLGSNGSVVPLFEKQIAEGGPVTITHPEVARYFMTIPEAVMLVLIAGAMSRGGELFLLDMGEPVKIVDLAKNMIQLAGLVPDKDIEIKFIGLRPGEKLHEELLIAGEDVVDTAYEKIKVCKNANNIDERILYEAVERFNVLVEDSYDHHAAVSILKRLIPAYHHEDKTVFRDVVTIVKPDTIASPTPPSSKKVQT